MANPPHAPTLTEQVARAVCEQWLGVKYED